MLTKNAGWLALFVLLGSSSAGFSQDKPRRCDGTVQSISGDSIVIQERNGDTAIFKVRSDSPVIFSKSKKTLSDIQPGQRVRVWATGKGEVTKVQIRNIKTRAQAPTAVPEPTGSGGIGGSRPVEGEVVEVDRERNAFTLKLRTGGTVHFAVEDSTRIHEHGAKGGLVDADFSALEPGQTVHLEVLYGKIDTININRIRE